MYPDADVGDSAIVSGVAFGQATTPSKRTRLDGDSEDVAGFSIDSRQSAAAAASGAGGASGGGGGGAGGDGRPPKPSRTDKKKLAAAQAMQSAVAAAVAGGGGVFERGSDARAVVFEPWVNEWANVLPSEVPAFAQKVAELLRSAGQTGSTGAGRPAVFRSDVPVAVVQRMFVDLITPKEPHVPKRPLPASAVENAVPLLTFTEFMLELRAAAQDVGMLADAIERATGGAVDWDRVMHTMEADQVYMAKRPGQSATSPLARLLSRVHLSRPVVPDEVRELFGRYQQWRQIVASAAKDATVPPEVVEARLVAMTSGAQLLQRLQSKIEADLMDDELVERLTYYADDDDAGVPSGAGGASGGGHAIVTRLFLSRTAVADKRSEDADDGDDIIDDDDEEEEEEGEEEEGQVEDEDDRDGGVDEYKEQAGDEQSAGGEDECTPQEQELVDQVYDEYMDFAAANLVQPSERVARPPRRLEDLMYGAQPEERVAAAAQLSQHQDVKQDVDEFLAGARTAKQVRWSHLTSEQLMSVIRETESRRGAEVLYELLDVLVSRRFINDRKPQLLELIIDKLKVTDRPESRKLVFDTQVVMAWYHLQDLNARAAEAIKAATVSAGRHGVDAAVDRILGAAQQEASEYVRAFLAMVGPARLPDLQRNTLGQDLLERLQPVAAPAASP